MIVQDFSLPNITTANWTLHVTCEKSRPILEVKVVQKVTKPGFFEKTLLNANECGALNQGERVFYWIFLSILDINTYVRPMQKVNRLERVFYNVHRLVTLVT